jgi:acyl-coenzyme A thioesterase PaaI-like protein
MNSVAPANRLTRSLDKLRRTLPTWLHLPAITLMVRRTIPLVGTCRLEIEAFERNRVAIKVARRRRVMNHIGSVHACVNILLAESATGLIVGQHVPDHSMPLIKTLNVAFVRRSSGEMRAEATLTDEQIALITTTDKGETLVPVRVWDATGEAPITVEALWAWTRKRKAEAMPA